jgi:hypothetical protein
MEPLVYLPNCYYLQFACEFAYEIYQTDIAFNFFVKLMCFAKLLLS